MSTHLSQWLHQISSDRQKSILNAHLPFLCLVESNLTQPSERHLKGKIICHPKSTLINYVWASASRDFEQNTGRLCNMWFSGQYGQWGKWLFFDTAPPHTFLFQGWSFPWQQFTLRLDFALFNSEIYNRCKHWKLYKSKLWKLAWEKWQHLDSKKWKKQSCFLRIFTVISNKEVKDRSTVCILSHLSFEM